MAEDTPLLAVYERGSDTKWGKKKKHIMPVSESKTQRKRRALRVEIEE